MTSGASLGRIAAVVSSLVLAGAYVVYRSRSASAGPPASRPSQIMPSSKSAPVFHRSGTDGTVSGQGSGASSQPVSARVSDHAAAQTPRQLMSGSKSAAVSIPLGPRDLGLSGPDPGAPAAAVSSPFNLDPATQPAVPQSIIAPAERVKGGTLMPSSKSAPVIAPADVLQWISPATQPAAPTREFSIQP